MSGANTETEPRSENATAIEERAASFLMERQSREDWSEIDQAELDAWLAASPANLVTFWRLEAALDRTHRLRALQHDSAPSRRALWPVFSRVAASLAAAAVLVFVGMTYALRPVEAIYTTPVGGRETVTLADGSRIVLNTDTVLRARIGAHSRAVTLDRGEAYFQVKHDAGRPFVVAAAGHRLTDIGTSFLVRSGPDRFEVAVMEGQVKFESRDGKLSQPLFLGAGDVATGAENTIYVAKEPKSDLVAKLGWRRGVLIFDHTTLGDAAVEFNRYNREKIVIADSNAARRVLGGTFPTDDVGAFTRLAHEVLGLRVENRGNETVISR